MFSTKKVYKPKNESFKFNDIDRASLKVIETPQIHSFLFIQVHSFIKLNIYFVMRHVLKYFAEGVRNL